MTGATLKNAPVAIAKPLCLALLWLSAGVAVAGDLRETRLNEVRQAYQRAREAHQSVPDQAEPAWLLGRACFDLAEFATNNAQRAELAEEGIAACLAAVQTDGASAGGHYYLAMNRGQLARTMSLGALKLVQQMERSFETVRSLDADFDRAGPHRNLGLLYFEAPGWPVSVGSRSKAKRHLTKAAEMTPTFPENRLNLMEAYARWGEEHLLRKEWASWEEVAAKAKAEFSGSRWDFEWNDWNRRLDAIKSRLGLVAKAPIVTDSTAPRSPEVP